MTKPQQRTSDNIRRGKDEEANQFAVALLMPERFVREEISKIKNFDLLNERHVKALADRFKVPPALIAYRIGQMKNKI